MPELPDVTVYLEALDARYLQVVEDMQLVARSNLIFGLHVHVGMPDAAIATAIALVALSASAQRTQESRAQALP